MRKLFHKIPKAVLLIGLIVAALLLVGLKPHKVYADFPNGMPGDTFPNNGYWEATPDTQLPYSVVATGSMQGPRTYIRMDVPTDTPGLTFNMTIVDACDNTPNKDVNGGVTNTTFYLTSVTSVILLSNNATVSNYGLPQWQIVSIQCTSGTDVKLQVTISSDQNNNPIHTITTQTGPKDYYYVMMNAVVDDYPNCSEFGNQSGCVDYENSFKVEVDSPIKVSATSQNKKGSKTLPNYTGLYNRSDRVSGAPHVSNDSSYYWGTSIAFAEPCNSGPLSNHIEFFDDDADAGNFQSDRHIQYQIIQFPRDGSGTGSVIASGTLNGGNNTNENIGDFNFDDKSSYELKLWDIYIRNSIQLKLPWDQINAFDLCSTPTTTVQGRIWNKARQNDPVTHHDDGDYNDAGIGGVQVTDCNGNTATSASNGWYSFTYNIGQSFCLRTATTPSGYNANVQIWPWGEGYGSCAKETFCNPPNTYECQVAGKQVQPTCTDQNIDRASDIGFDFVFTPNPPTGKISGPLLVVLGDPAPTYKATGHSDLSDVKLLEMFVAPTPLPADRWGPINSGSGKDCGSNVADCSDSQKWTPTAIGTYYLVTNVHTPDLACSGNAVGGTTDLWGNAVAGWYDCGSSSRITVRVIARPSFTNPITGSCTNDIKGNVTDADDPSAELTVILVVDGSDTNVRQTTSSHNFDFSEHKQWSDYGTHHFAVKAKGVNGSGSPDGYDKTSNTLTLGPCAPPTCGNATTTPPGIPEAGTPFTITVNFNYSPGNRGRTIDASSGQTMHLTVTGLYDRNPQGYIGYKPVPGWPPNAGQATTSSITAPSPGVNHVSMTVGGGSMPTLSCAWGVPTGNKPYVKAFSSDVLAGGKFGTGVCTTPGKIIGWYNTTSQSGAGTQFNALALDAITDFASATLRSGAPARPTGLTLANTAAAGTFGGRFGVSRCIPDYYGAKPASLSAEDPVGGKFVITAGTTNAHYIKPSSGTIQLLAPSGIANGQSITLYINGNAYISSSVKYNGAGSWAAQSDIPSLYVITRGNIYIDPAVSQLDGVYVAQDNGSGHKGRIYTCATSTGPVAAGSIFNSCNNLLTVNGAFIAEQIKLLRTPGSLRFSASDEYPYGPSHNCDGPSRPVCSAEIFNFSPDVYLGSPALPPSSGGHNGKYDYIVSLPPVL